MHLYHTPHIYQLILKKNYSVLCLEKCTDRQYEETILSFLLKNNNVYFITICMQRIFILKNAQMEGQNAIFFNNANVL